MAAQQYYHQDDPTHDQQHLLSSHETPPSNLSFNHPSPLKPLHLVTHHSRQSSLENYQALEQAHSTDAALKARIRRLRLISRIIAFLISVAVLIPISMTLAKFLSTQHTYRTMTTADGTQVTRTAWAHDARAWPTWMYFSVAVVSVVLNFATVCSYKYGVEKANVANTVTSAFTWIVMVGNLVVWSVAAGLYRREKDKNGKSNDLWGWTCSAAARAIQKEFREEVDFGQYCNVQSASWLVGLVQAGAALLTVVIYILVLMRRRSKKVVKQQMRLSGYQHTGR